MRVLVIAMLLILSSCNTTTSILAGSSHACGSLHVEGYITDTEGEVLIVKAPPEWTPEQVIEFCMGVK